jgi:hypothetical protein
MAQGTEPVVISACAPLDKDRKGIDLSTFAASVGGGIEAVGKHWLASPKWPVDRVSEGDLVIGIGFPGLHRRPDIKNGQEGLVMVESFVSGRVSSVSQRHFVLADEDADRWVAQLDAEHEYEASWGGMSGGVFFKVIAENNYQLAGFMYEGGATWNDGSTDDLRSNIYVTHADFIKADGTLDHGRIPF